MKLLIFCFSLLLSSFAWTQTKFYKVYNDNGYDEGQGIVELSDSSYMITGNSSSFFEGPSQAYLMKIDKNGNHLWAKSYGFSEADGGKRVLNWNDSIFYIIGYSQTTNGNGFDVLFVKTDKNGNELLIKTIGNTDWEYANDAIFTADSNIYIVGESTASSSSKEMLIMKLDKDGNLIWSQKKGSSIGDDYLSKIDTLNNNTFFAVGAAFNEDSTLQKAYVTQFDGDGLMSWEKTYGDHGTYALYDFYLNAGYLYANGKQYINETLENDSYILRIGQDGSDYIYDIQSNSVGDFVFVGAVLLNDKSKSYLAWRHRDQYSSLNSYDVSYTRYEADMEFEWLNPSIPSVHVNSMYDESFGEIIPTIDGGWISVGSIESNELGGTGVYVIKMRPTDDFPTVSFNAGQSLVEIDEIVKDELTMFPNPAIDFVTIKVKSSEAQDLLIVDIKGRIVLKSSILETKQIDLSQFESGIYFVKVGNTCMKLNVSK